MSDALLLGDTAAVHLTGVVWYTAAASDALLLRDMAAVHLRCMV